MNDFNLKKYLGNNPLITEYGEDEFDRSPEMYSGGKSDREGPDELSLKAGESVIYQGRKAIFKRHGHPGKTAHIEVDDEYIEVPVSKLKKDPDYDYTKASPHAIKKLEEERYGSSRGLDMGNGVDEEDNAYNIAVTIANNIDKYNTSPTSLGTGVAYVLKEKYGKQYSKSLVDALQKELNRKPHPPQDPSEL